MGNSGDQRSARPFQTFSGSPDSVEDLDRQIAEGIAAEEKGELVDGETAMAEIRAELKARHRRA
jgi:hypothetical protein